MTKKIVLLFICSLITLSLVIMSCDETESGGKVEEEDTGQTVTIGGDGEKEVVEEERDEVMSPETPKYGGVITLVSGGDPGTFDESAGMLHSSAYTLKLTNQELMQGDWSKGLAGTGEVDWANRNLNNIDGKTGCIAESWEIPELGTMIFNIRHGVQYALNPDSEASRLVNGREFTSQDAEVSLNVLTHTGKMSAISLGDTRFSTITALDEWTLEIKMPVNSAEDVMIIGDFASITPPEVSEKYGDMTDWKNSVGTGPFILIDYIPGSSATLIRNENYWEKDPIGPGKGNQLPYLDGVKYLIIGDTSTQLAALRTGKIDILHSVSWEDAEFLTKSIPDTNSHSYYVSAGLAINMRTNKPELPFYQKEVRRALMMATDFETIKQSYCGGEAQILSWPILRVKGYEDAYLPLEEAPASVQELYTYNPDKAIQLLVDAGYPDGFQTECTVANVPKFIDYLSIIRDQWARVNVDLQIVPVESSAFTGITFGRAHKEMIMSGPAPICNLYNAIFYTGAKFGGNLSEVNDPRGYEVKDAMGRVALTDPAEANRIHKEFLAYALDQAWVIPGVTSPGYNVWWPWIQNYHGETSIGYDNTYNYSKYIWMDTEMKKSMGY